jgi:nucleotide-binding universal stress UspA family protein
VETLPPEGEASISPLLAEWAGQEEAAARRAAETAAALLRQRGITTAVRVRRGSAGEAIVEQARENAAELIVVGSHGVGTMERLLVGSVSERVARYAFCSVLVARGPGPGLHNAPDHPAGGAPPPALRRVIVAVDGSLSATQALDAFARLPLPAEAAVTLLYVVRPSDLVAPFPVSTDVSWDTVVEHYDHERLAAGEAILHDAQERLRAVGHQATLEVRCGAPADELVAAARQTGADLLVVGGANRSALGGLLLGSVSDRVLTRAPCSVLVGRSADGTGKERGIPE